MPLIIAILKCQSISVRVNYLPGFCDGYPSVRGADSTNRFVCVSYGSVRCLRHHKPYCVVGCACQVLSFIRCESALCHVLMCDSLRVRKNTYILPHVSMRFSQLDI